MTFFQRITAQILFLLFGVPAVLGPGLHAFLPHMGEADCCAFRTVPVEKTFLPNADSCQRGHGEPCPNGPSGNDQVLFPTIQLGNSPESHSDACPICLFCSANKCLLPPVMVSLDLIPVNSIILFNQTPVLLNARTQLVVRGPPAAV